MKQSTLFYNISLLIQVRSGDAAPLTHHDFNEVPFIKDAFLIANSLGKISAFGEMKDLPFDFEGKRIDVGGRVLMPTWVDSHTHLVFAGSRETEFEARIQGLSYEEIAKRGGGILNSAKKLHETSEDQLFIDAKSRLHEVIMMGTGAIEIKSGYGLSFDDELKMLKVIRRLKEISPIPIKATFLGAHTYPADFKNDHSGYIDLIINQLLPKIAEEKLADYCDVFCEKVAFSAEEMDIILEKARQHGLKAKIHTNQFNSIGGIEVALKHKAISVDHLEVFNDDEVALLSSSKGSTIVTLLPSAPFFLNDHYPKAQTLINNNIPIALATDYNPGSSPSGKMAFVLSLACIKMKMTPEQAFNAATINAAAALELSDELGSIAIGKNASFIIAKPAVKSLAYLPYCFGNNWIDEVYINAKKYD